MHVIIVLLTTAAAVAFFLMIIIIIIIRYTPSPHSSYDDESGQEVQRYKLQNKRTSDGARQLVHHAYSNYFWYDLGCRRHFILPCH